MNAKEILQQARKLEEQAEYLMLQIERMRSRAAGGSAGNPVNGLIGGETEYEIEDAVIGIIEAEEQLSGVLERLFETRAELLEMIQKIRDGRLQLILIYRYLYYKRWDEIAEKTGYSTRHLMRRHREGLAEVERRLAENRDSK